jgi:hypothetical protein
LADVQQPWYMAPTESRVGESGATIKIGWQAEVKGEAGEVEVGGQQIDKLEDSVQPCKLGNRVDGRAAAIKASDMGVAVENQLSVWSRRVGSNTAGVRKRVTWWSSCGKE